MSMQLESSFNEEFLDSFANTIENKFNQSDFNVQFPQLNERNVSDFFMFLMWKKKISKNVLIWFSRNFDFRISLSFKRFSQTFNFLALQKVAVISSLVELDLSDCKKLEPTDFCNLNGLKFLTKLDASKTKMNDLAIKEMKLPNLRHLYLTDTNITDLGISLLPKFSFLEDLNMSRNRITDVGIIVLSKSDLVYTLKKLNIDSTKVTDKCLQYIPKFINLKFLSMKSSNVNFNKLSEIKINSVNVTISPSFELVFDRPNSMLYQAKLSNINWNTRELEVNLTVIENNYRKRNRAETEELNKSLTCPSSERKINFFKSPPSSPSTTYSSPSPSSPSFLTSPLWSLRDNSPCKLDNSFNNASCKSSPLSKVVMHSSFETGVASTFDFVDSDDEMIHESFLVIPTTSTPSTSSLPSRPLKKGRFS